MMHVMFLLNFRIGLQMIVIEEFSMLKASFFFFFFFFFWEGKIFITQVQ